MSKFVGGVFQQASVKLDNPEPLILIGTGANGRDMLVFSPLQETNKYKQLQMIETIEEFLQLTRKAILESLE